MKHVIILVIATIFTNIAWTAEEEQAARFEDIGAGSGALIGAIAGGPVGAILGAATGIWIVDRFNEERSISSDFERRWVKQVIRSKV